MWQYLCTQIRYPESHIPSRRTYYRIVDQFTQDGSVNPPPKTRQRTKTDEQYGIVLLVAVNHYSNVSTREFSRVQTCLRYVSTVYRISPVKAINPYLH